MKYHNGGSKYYFITVCTKNRINYFCDIENNRGISSNLNDIGKLISYWWKEIPRHFEDVILDEFVIMPNYLHGILVIKNDGQKNKVIQWFKTITTISYLMGMRMDGWPKINEQLWQKKYYKQIINNEKDYLMIREYIRNNPGIIF